MALSPGYAFLAIGGVILLVAFIFVLLPNENNATTDTQANIKSAASQQPTPGWSAPTPVVLSPQSSCIQYTFPSRIVSNTMLYNPVTYAYDSLIYNSQGVPSGSTPDNPILTNIHVTNAICNNPNQITARLVEHTCRSTALQGLGCVKKDGQVAPINATEQYFEPCPVSPCSTVLSFVSTAFVANIGKCISATTGNLVECKDTPDIEFNVSRHDAQTFNPSENGVYARIGHPASNTCLVPNADKTGVIAGPCGTNNGTVWAIVPPFNTSVNINGKDTAVTSCQQLVYNPTGVYPAAADAVNYIKSNNLKSIRGDPNTGAVTLSPFVFDCRDIHDGDYNVNHGEWSISQFIDFSLYNDIATANANIYPLLPNFPGQL